LSASTAQRWLNRAGEAARRTVPGQLGGVRTSGQLATDGLWARLREGTTRVVLLLTHSVSGGVWPPVVARGEHEPGQWQRLFVRACGAGLDATEPWGVTSDGATGLAGYLRQHWSWVLHQRCVFHVLRTGRDAVRGPPGLTREAKRAQRREVLAAARTIGDTTERETCRRRWKEFAATWRGQEPDAVAALERAFEATLGYCAAIGWARERGETWAPHYLRTTSALERVDRALRQKARQVGAFHTAGALAAAVVLVAAHRHLTIALPPRALWTNSLEEALLVA
jgi:transposase-like protein